MAPIASTSLRDAPDGQAIATLTPHSTLQTLARDRGWVRVRAEGWVKETEIAPVDSSRTLLSAADLRVNPEGADARRLASSAPVAATLAATVRVGRSEPVGVPILDAQSLTRR